MHLRHTHNPNLVLLNNINHWNNLPVQKECGPLVAGYLERILDTLDAALNEYPRICAIRFDLRFPLGYWNPDTSVISRFMESLNAKLRADALRKERSGVRTHPCRLRYVWVKERNSSINWHYHVCIFLNRDAYFTLGKFQSDCKSDIAGTSVNDEHIAASNMASRIRDAWVSALGVSLSNVVGLVHFPENPVYRINSNATTAIMNRDKLFYRLSYFAKVETKHYGDHSNSFGCSRI